MRCCLRRVLLAAFCTAPRNEHDADSLADRRTLQESLAGGAVLQVDQAAPANQEIPGRQRERGEDANLVRRGNLRADRDHKKKLHVDASVYTCLQILSVSIFEKTELLCALQPDARQTDVEHPANQLNLFDF